MRCIVLLANLSLLLSSCLLAAPEISIEKYIQSDFLTKEIELKNSFQDKKLESLYVQKKQSFKYPSYDDFWRFTFEYWMVKNAKYLKWDQSIANEEFNQELRSLFQSTNIKIKKFKVFILPTSWISHFAIPKGNSEFYFFISQQFIKEAALKSSQAAIVLFDDYIKLKNGFLMKFLQDTDFVKKLGKDFYLNKQPDIPGFEKLVEKISYFFRFYGYQFNHAFESYQDIKSMGDKSNKELISRFQKTYSQVYQSRDRLMKKFPRIEGLYPSIMMYHSWFQK